ncbi:hypothetical protein XELAEV_18024735mg [Xenopus laevis]|uniref:Uncharacterized protein n=1 Tax=Xenopus laevis TaxID=8355 RepID=A0A974HLJ0_XENLA|nr:hypothetical protein XELAEV_18024735mg [Xenopus laevis]
MPHNREFLWFLTNYFYFLLNSLGDGICPSEGQIGAGSNGTTVSRHFSQCNQGDVSCLKIQGIDKVRNWSRGGIKLKKLLELEVRWIFILDTCKHKGLNVRWDVSCHV